MTLHTSPTAFISRHDELSTLLAYLRQQVPVALQGPPGCGKTTAVQHCAATLGRPLVTVACSQDLSVHDLVGRFHLRGGETAFLEGPLLRAMRLGALLYLDEADRAPQDVWSVLHSALDHRRAQHVPELDALVVAAPGFAVVASYNPVLSSRTNGLPHAVRQRFVFLTFDYLDEAAEIDLLMRQAGAGVEVARTLVAIGKATREHMRSQHQPGASTRALLQAAAVHPGLLGLHEAVETAIIARLTDNPGQRETLRSLLEAKGLCSFRDLGAPPQAVPGGATAAEDSEFHLPVPRLISTTPAQS
ncbi:MAG: AAA family ATPase [Pseudomonadota bacterium]